MRAATLLAVMLLSSTSGTLASAQAGRFEYRVVFANAQELERRLDEAGQRGFSCAMIARPDPDAPIAGVAVVLSRAAGATPAAVTHRVVKGGYSGSDLPALLNHAASGGYRLCGVAFVDGQVPSIIAVMTRSASGWTYGAEVLSDYRGALVRLNAAGKNGFVPVAASPIGNNRVSELRSWVVVTEQPATARRRIDVAVRSGSGPESLQKSLGEQTSQGYRAALVWKEGKDVVVMMTREADAPAAAASASYVVEGIASDGMHSVSRPYVFDAPYLSDQRLVITEKSGSASNEAVEDPLPPIGVTGTAAPGPLGTLSDHLTRLRDYAVGAISVRRSGARNELILRTVMTRR
jgi:hypothetical protein